MRFGRYPKPISMSRGGQRGEDEERVRGAQKEMKAVRLKRGLNGLDGEAV